MNYTKKLIPFVLILSLCGCKKAAEETPAPAPDAQPAVEAPEAKADAPEAKADVPEPKADVPEAKADTADAKADTPFQVDFTSKDFPEIHTKVDTQPMPWGELQRTTLLWSDDIVIFHEIPIFKEESKVFKDINIFLKEANQSFFTKENLASPWEYLYERHEHQSKDDIEKDDKYTYTFTAEVTENSNKYISVLFTRDWYMGGVSDAGYKTAVFDAKTGNVLKLTDYYHKSDKEVRDIVTQSIKAYLKKNDLDSSLMEWGSIENLNDYKFYIKEGIPHAVFSRYEIAVGAAGAFDIELQ